jgi:hypothetical protein
MMTASWRSYFQAALAGECAGAFTQVVFAIASGTSLESPHAEPCGTSARCTMASVTIRSPAGSSESAVIGNH